MHQALQQSSHAASNRQEVIVQTAKHKEKQDWKVIIDDWEISDLTQPQYCESKGLSLSTFGYYRGKYNAEKKASGKMVGIALEKNIAHSKPSSRYYILLPSGVTVG